MITLTDEELASINRAILTRYGIDFFNYETNSLKRRVARVIDKYQFESSLGLWRELISNKDFINVYIDELTVGLTEMFRNPDFWIKLKNDIIPHISNNKTISIWHAGCSTGEEVYSMGILLNEENLLWKTEIIGTDLNSQSIENCKLGTFNAMYKDLYTKNYINQNGRYQLEKYYEVNGENLRFNKVPFKQIQFYQHNLTKDPMNKQFDIIFCRNVMIYFDEVLKIKVLKQFADALKPNGFLIIGYYDALPNQFSDFFTLYDPSIKTYRKILA
jgi:chemotaxis protein methyltransferase CheR